MHILFRYHTLATESDVEAFIGDLKEFSGQLFLPCLFDKKILDLCTSKILPTIFEGLHGDRLKITVGNSRHLLGIMKKWMPAGINFMSTGEFVRSFLKSFQEQDVLLINTPPRNNK